MAVKFGRAPGACREMRPDDRSVLMRAEQGLCSRKGLARVALLIANDGTTWTPLPAAEAGPGEAYNVELLIAMPSDSLGCKRQRSASIMPL